jgi:dipeptidyl aminopeptidase/acylaminoacyl peptidase
VSWRCALIVGLVSAAALAAPGPWPLERLFTRPFVWGTPPDRVKWSKQGHTLAFLWNAEGGAFRDLYAYDPEARALRRLTRFESGDDPLTRSAAEKDDRRKQFLPPAEGLTDFDLTLDGSRAAFTYRGDLYTVRTDGAEPPFRLTRTKTAETAPQFSPDGTRLAFMRDGQVFTQDLKNGQLWQITDIEGEGNSLASYRWSRDGKRLLYTVRVGTGRRLVLPNYSGRLVTTQPLPRTVAGDPAPETKVFVAPADGGPPREMEAGPWGSKSYASEPEWSPDSAHILLRVTHPNLKQSQILVLDPATGKAKVVFEDRDVAWIETPFVTWSPDSRAILFTSERDGWSHLYKVAITGGEAQQITRGPWEIHSERTWGHDSQWIGDYIYYYSTEASTAERQFYRIHPDGSGKERLSQKEGLNVGVVSEDGRYTAMLFTDLHQPWELSVKGERVTRATRPEFAQYPWPETRFVTFPSLKDRKPVAAKMLIPPGTAKRRPAILFIHGSGYATSVLKQWGAYHDLRYVFNCYLANRGYVVLDMDYRGSSGYGRDWRTGVYLHMGGRDLEDVLGAVEYLRGLGTVDMSRVGIWGSSYGGFMTNMAMFLSPDTFRAGAAFSAVNDWENYNAFYTEQRLTKPQENPEAYRRSSPITFAGMLKNRLLMVHGIVDSNVMFQDAVELSEKLTHEGKDFEEAYYAEEDHLFIRDESLIDAFRRAATFFDRWLQ